MFKIKHPSFLSLYSLYSSILLLPGKFSFSLSIIEVEQVEDTSDNDHNLL